MAVRNACTLVSDGRQKEDMCKIKKVRLTIGERLRARPTARMFIFFIFLVFARGHVLLLVGKWRFSPHSKHVKNGHFTQNLNEKPVFLGKL